MTSRVMKLGGSLLEFDEIPDALRCWLAAQPAAANVLIVGGGRLVEAIRNLDARFALGQAAAHWLAVRTMGVNARLAVSLWPEFSLMTRFEELRGALEAGHSHLVFDVEEFLRRQEPRLPGRPLEIGWHVTSDSIAARVAAVIGAEELVLLKSSLPERRSVSCQEAAALGCVDDFFPLAGRVAEMRAVNLRSRYFDEMRICS